MFCWTNELVDANESLSHIGSWRYHIRDMSGRLVHPHRHYARHRRLPNSDPRWRLESNHQEQDGYHTASMIGNKSN